MYLKMSYKEQSRYLAGPIALLKMQCTRVENSVADDAVQVGTPSIYDQHWLKNRSSEAERLLKPVWVVTLKWWVIIVHFNDYWLLV